MRIVSLGLAMLLVACSSVTSGSETSASPPMTQARQPVVVKPTPTQQGQTLPITAQAKIGNQSIDLEVTRTPEQQEMGLMFRTSLAANRGMLFIFQPPQPVRFWMKNTLIPLDMVFLKNGKVQYIARDVPPCKKDPCATYGPLTGVEIDQVIELRAGRAKELGLKTGDTITIQFLK